MLTLDSTIPIVFGEIQGSLNSLKSLGLIIIIEILLREDVYGYSPWHVCHTCRSALEGSLFHLYKCRNVVSM